MNLNRNEDAMTKAQLQEIIYKQGVKIALQKVVISGLQRDLNKKKCVTCGQGGE